jgi:hypothetical protein
MVDEPALARDVRTPSPRQVRQRAAGNQQALAPDSTSAMKMPSLAGAAAFLARSWASAQGGDPDRGSGSRHAPSMSRRRAGYAVASASDGAKDGA